MRDRFTLGDRLLIGAALLIFAALAIFDFGEFWQGCNDPDRSAYRYYRANYDNCPADGIVSAVTDFGSAIHRRREDLNAISTAVIAAFTIVLAWATHRQARLTRL